MSYFSLIKTEIEKKISLPVPDKAKAKSVYFGGGSPSIMPVIFFEKIMNILSDKFTLLPEAEITVEVNPESADEDKLKALKENGVNRISIGAQTSYENSLKLSGRIHSKKDISKSVANTRRAGFKNISLDLIIGLPTKKDDEKTAVKILNDDINFLTELDPEHISAYLLNLEAGTILHNAYINGDYRFIRESESAELYELFCQKISGFGYNQYEISNFSKKGMESRHNLNYWERGEYIGIGPSASSFLKTESNGNGSCVEIRKTNPSDINRYIEYLETTTANSVNAGERVNQFISFDILTKKDIINEEIFLSLRTNKGMPIKRLYELVPESGVLKNLINEGFIRHNGENVSLTIKGMLLSSEIFSRIML